MKIYLLVLILIWCVVEESVAKGHPVGTYFDYGEVYGRFKSLTDQDPQIGLDYIDSVYHYVEFEKNDTVRGSITEFKAKGHYIANQDVDSTIFYALEAEKYFRKSEFNGGLASVLTLIAKMYQVNRDYENCIRYYRKCEEPIAASGQEIRKYHLLKNMGLVFSELGQLDSASLYFEQAEKGYFKIQEELGKPLSFSDLYSYQASNFNKLKQYDKAIEYFKKLLKMSKATESSKKRTYYTASKGIAISYFNLGNVDSTLKYAKRSLSLVDSNSTFYEIEQGNSMMADAYLLDGDYKNAYDYLAKAYDTKDDRYKSIMENNALSLKAKYDADALENDLALQKEREVILAAKNTKLKWALGLGMVLLFASIWFFVKSRNRTKELGLVNMELEKSNEDKGILLKEIHHRVKNNLQSISSMLNMQRRRVEDPDTKLALSDSRNRVQAMALIHESFYQNGDLSKVDLEEFLFSLSNELLTVFGMDKDVKLDIDVKKIKIPSTIIIPLGMMLNELLTNAFKYGVNDDSDKICIRALFTDSNLKIVIHDHGEGFDYGTTPQGLGSILLKSFATQIDAEVNYSNNNGCEVSIVIPKKPNFDT